METQEKRGRGRPRKNVVEEHVITESGSEPVEIRTKPSRPKRTKISGRRNILTVEAPKGMVGRWVVDTDHGYRISQLLELGYSFLEDKYLDVGEVETHSNRQSTSVLSRQVNRTGEVAYFMVIDKDLYDFYQSQKQEEVDDSERAMREDLHKDGNYGSFKQETRYNEPD